MGELMDVFTRYVESDTMKDPNPDYAKTSKGKENGDSKGQQQGN